MSIKDQAVLVSVETRSPQKTKLDKSTSKEVAANKNANESATRVINDLYPKRLIQPIENMEGKARTLLQGPKTYAWSRNKFLLPNVEVMDFLNEAGQIELGYQQAVTAFMQNFTNVMLEAQNDLGALFDASVYPDLEELRDSFYLKFTIDPVTDNGDFRIQCDEETRTAIAERSKHNTLDRFKGLAKTVRDTLAKRIKHLVATMEKPEREIRDKETNQVTGYACAVFRDSTFDLLLEQCDLVLKFGDDVMLPEHMALAREIRAELPTPKSARSDKSVRDMIAHEGKEWLADLDLSSVQPTLHHPDPEPQYNEATDLAVNAALIDPEPEPDEETEPTTLQDEHAIPPNPSAALMADIDAMFADDL